MSLRVLRRLPSRCVHIPEQCQYTTLHTTGTCWPSSQTPATAYSSSLGQRRRKALVQITGPRHYCTSNVSINGPDPGGRLQELLEESSDPTVTDGQDLVYWEPPPHHTNRNYKSAEQVAEEVAKGPRLDPCFASIILFPGTSNLTKRLISRKLLAVPVVKEMFNIASDILGFDLKETCLRESSHYRSQEQILQPAVLVSSLAAVERLQHERPGALELCAAAAGYGVGEITALTFAGALSFEDAVRLVKVRSEAMMLASDLHAGGAVRVNCVAACRLSLVCAAAVEHCKRMGVEDPHCSVAAHLHPSCKVLAGSMEALSFLEKYSEELKLKRVVRLQDCGAFHTELMKPASDVIAQALKQMTINKPSVRVISAANDKEYSTPEVICRVLPLQVRRPVMWQQLMGRLYDRPRGLGFPTTYECGPSGGALTWILTVNNDKAARNSNVVMA